MAIKPTLFWTLVRDWHVGGFKVMRVTTEKTTKICGVIGDNPVTVNRTSTVGQFKTELEAQGRIDEVLAVRRRYAPILTQARENLRVAEVRERDAIEKAVTRAPGRVMLERVG